MSNEHFNLIGRFYNKVAQFSFDEQLIEFLDLPCDGLFLDAGGGTGRVAQGLKKLVSEAVVVDVALGMLTHANGKGLDCVLAPAEALPFQGNTFDRILMMDAFHHVRDHRQTIKDLFRVLKKGGCLVIVEPDIHNAVVKLIALAEKLLLMRSHFFSGEMIASMISPISSSVELKFINHHAWVIVRK